VTRSKIAKRILENKVLFDGQSIRKEKDTVKGKNRKEAKKIDGCSTR
jgi:hypothetical protein